MLDELNNDFNDYIGQAGRLRIYYGTTYLDTPNGNDVGTFANEITNMWKNNSYVVVGANGGGLCYLNSKHIKAIHYISNGGM